MKLIVLFLTIASLQVSANSYAQNVTIQAEKESFKSVLRKIRKQTGKDFLYNTREVNEHQIVNLTVRNEPWLKALDQLLSRQNLKYKINGNTVLIQPSAKEEISMVSAQQTLRGMVRNEAGDAVGGATVTLVETGNSVATDEYGTFVFEQAPASGTLHINSLGYQVLSVPYTNYTVPELVLSSALHEVEEVIVVGYGVQSKKELIGSVSQVNAEQVNTRSVPQLSQALTGQMPGVSVIQRSGQPGASGGEVQIRGVGSFGAGTGALILVDGIPVNSMNDVDPNDVASISVLKDASSAAIYGSRAANGVILVTTKLGGEEDRLKVNYNGYVGMQRPTAFPEFVNSWEYATAMNEAAPGAYTPEQIQLFREGTNPDLYPNENHMNAFFKEQALQTAHNISLSNRTKNGQYALSFGYLNQDGIVEKNNYNRYNTRLNLVSNLSDKVTLTSRLSAIKTEDKQPAIPPTLDFNDMLNMIGQTVRYPSIYPIRMSNGDWGAGLVQKGTPYSWLQSESFYNNNITELGANFRLDWQLIPELKLSAIGGYTQEDSREKRFLGAQRINDDINLTPANLDQESGQNRYGIFQGLAEYTKAFDDHNLNVLVGYSLEKNHDEFIRGFRQNFPGNDLTQLDVGSPEGQLNWGSADEWALESYFGRVQYNFRSRYLFEGTLRYDGSSRFPTHQKYALFPSVAAGWRISDEPFMGDIPWLQDLKLKASYGVLGNQNIGNYPYQNILRFDNNYPFGDVIHTGVARINITDPNLRWESTRTADIGIDGSFLNGMLSFSATYYDRYTYDILVSPASSVSTVLGYGLEPQNSGKLKNTGFEFELAHQQSKNDWHYGVNVNFTMVNNEVIDLGVGNIVQPNGLVGNGSDLFIGHPMGLYYGYRTSGLFTDAEDVASWHDQSAINPNTQPGDIRYLDISGPDGVPDGRVDATYDRVVLGSNIPKYNFGINLQGGYKQFDLSMLFQGVAGVSGYLNNYAGFAFHQQGNIQRWQYEGRWNPENPNPNAAYPRLEIGGSSPNTLMSDFWMLNASYLRLKNIQLGYSFKTERLRTLGIDALRLYVNGENLFMTSNYRQGWDPEVNTSGSYYPILRNYMFGLNVTF